MGPTYIRDTYIVQDVRCFGSFKLGPLQFAKMGTTKHEHTREKNDGDYLGGERGKPESAVEAARAAEIALVVHFIPTDRLTD